MLALFVKVPTMQRLRKIRSFSRIPNILQITVRFRTPPLVTYVNRLYSKCNLIAETRFVIENIYRKMTIRGHSKVMCACPIYCAALYGQFVINALQMPYYNNNYYYCNDSPRPLPSGTRPGYPAPRSTTTDRTHCRRAKGRCDRYPP